MFTFRSVNTLKHTFIPTTVTYIQTHTRSKQHLPVRNDLPNLKKLNIRNRVQFISFKANRQAVFKLRFAESWGSPGMSPLL
jgi:hypothetical protein